MPASTRERRQAVHRVMKMVDKYLAAQPQTTLITDGFGLMTWGELRRHVKAAIKLTANPKIRKPK